MERIQLRLTGTGLRSSDSHVVVPRIPVKGDVIAPETEYDGVIYYVVEEVIFSFPQFMLTDDSDPQTHPAIREDFTPESVFVVARRRA